MPSTTAYSTLPTHGVNTIANEVHNTIKRPGLSTFILTKIILFHSRSYQDTKTPFVPSLLAWSSTQNILNKGNKFYKLQFFFFFFQKTFNDSILYKNLTSPPPFRITRHSPSTNVNILLCIVKLHKNTLQVSTTRATLPLKIMDLELLIYIITHINIGCTNR